MENVMEKKGLDAFQLKLIALITMLIDHVGIVFFPDCVILRIIGRPAFPIFCFLLVEGFFRTRSVRQYLFRLGLFALISEIPYDLLFMGKIVSFGHQNVLLDLFLGILMISLLERLTNKWAGAGIAVGAIILSGVLRLDYGMVGQLLILIFYLFRERFLVKLVGVGAVNLIAGPVQAFGVAAMLPISLYNGKRGRKLKYFFYAFYPVHLMVLYGIQQLLQYTGVLPVI